MDRKGISEAFEQRIAAERQTAEEKARKIAETREAVDAYLTAFRWAQQIVSMRGFHPEDLDTHPSHNYPAHPTDSQLIPIGPLTDDTTIPNRYGFARVSIQLSEPEPRVRITQERRFLFVRDVEIEEPAEGEYGPPCGYSVDIYSGDSNGYALARMPEASARFKDLELLHTLRDYDLEVHHSTYPLSEAQNMLSSMKLVYEAAFATSAPNA